MRHHAVTRPGATGEDLVVVEAPVRSRRPLIAAAAVATALIIVVFIGLQLTAESPEYCGGVHRDLGGCDDNQPTFVGATCDAVATEFGRQLNEREVAILRGPDAVDGQRRSAQFSSTEMLLATRANQHLRDIRIVAECGVDEFVAVAEPAFSDELRSNVGRFITELTDLPDQTYEDWRERLVQTLSVIDMDENLDNNGNPI